MNIIAEVGDYGHTITVIKKDSGKYDVIKDGELRHPDCDADAAIRALAQYAHNYIIIASPFLL